MNINKLSYIFIVILFSVSAVFPVFSDVSEIKERTLLEENNIKIIHHAEESYWNKNDPFDEGEMILFYNNKEKILSPISYYKYSNNEFLHLPKLNFVVYIEYIHEGRQTLKLFDYLNEKKYSLDYLSHEFSLSENVDYGFYDLQLSPSGKYFSVQASWFELIGKLFIFDISKIKEGNIGNSYFIPDFDEVHNVDWKEGDIITFRDGLKLINDTEPKIEDKIEGDIKTQSFTKTGIYPPSPFSDLPETDEDYEYVLKAKADEWLEGYSDDTVKMEQPVNRAEFAKIVVQAFGVEAQAIPDTVGMICPDVPKEQWYSGVFYTAKQLGLIEGYPDVKKDKSEWLCKPNQTINKVETLKVVLKLAKLNIINVALGNQYEDTGAFEWYSPYTAYSKTKNLIKVTGNKLYPATPMTRREMIVLTVKVKELVDQGVVNF